MKKHNLEYCFLNPDSMNWLKTTELAGRTCYKSEKRIKEGSEVSFNNMLCNTYKHLSVMEHSLITVWFRANRGFTHEMVRHRHCSFSQESTRYCNYGKNADGLNILPPIAYAKGGDMEEASLIFTSAFLQAEYYYKELLKIGTPVELARDVLPIGVKTDIVVSGNYRTWVELLRQRLTKQAHPIMRAMLTPLARDLKERIPVVFDSLELLEQDNLLNYANEITLNEYHERIGAGE
jgi:thymidylate synthase (FAD)